MSNDDVTMVTTTVEIPPDDLARARASGIDISALVRTALSECLVAEALGREIDGYVAAFADWAPADDWWDWTNAPK